MRDVRGRLITTRRCLSGPETDLVAQCSRVVLDGEASIEFKFINGGVLMSAQRQRLIVKRSEIIEPFAGGFVPKFTRQSKCLPKIQRKFGFEVVDQAFQFTEDIGAINDEIAVAR